MSRDSRMTSAPRCALLTSAAAANSIEFGASFVYGSPSSKDNADMAYHDATVNSDERVEDNFTIGDLLVRGVDYTKREDLSHRGRHTEDENKRMVKAMSTTWDTSLSNGSAPTNSVHSSMHDTSNDDFIVSNSALGHGHIQLGNCSAYALVRSGPTGTKKCVQGGFYTGTKRSGRDVAGAHATPRPLLQQTFLDFGQSNLSMGTRCPHCSMLYTQHDEDRALHRRFCRHIQVQHTTHLARQKGKSRRGSSSNSTRCALRNLGCLTSMNDPYDAPTASRQYCHSARNRVLDTVCRAQHGCSFTESNSASTYSCDTDKNSSNTPDRTSHNNYNCNISAGYRPVLDGCDLLSNARTVTLLERLAQRRTVSSVAHSAQLRTLNCAHDSASSYAQYTNAGQRSRLRNAILYESQVTCEKEEDVLISFHWFAVYTVRYTRTCLHEPASKRVVRESNGKRQTKSDTTPAEHVSGAVAGHSPVQAPQRRRRTRHGTDRGGALFRDAVHLLHGVGVHTLCAGVVSDCVEFVTDGADSREVSSPDTHKDGLMKRGDYARYRPSQNNSSCSNCYHVNGEKRRLGRTNEDGEGISENKCNVVCNDCMTSGSTDGACSRASAPAMVSVFVVDTREKRLLCVVAGHSRVREQDPELRLVRALQEDTSMTTSHSDAGGNGTEGFVGVETQRCYTVCDVTLLWVSSCSAGDALDLYRATLRHASTLLSAHASTNANDGTGEMTSDRTRRATAGPLDVMFAKARADANHDDVTITAGSECVRHAQDSRQSVHDRAPRHDTVRASPWASATQPNEPICVLPSTNDCSVTQQQQLSVCQSSWMSRRTVVCALRYALWALGRKIIYGVQLHPQQHFSFASEAVQSMAHRCGAASCIDDACVRFNTKVGMSEDCCTEQQAVEALLWRCSGNGCCSCEARSRVEHLPQLHACFCAADSRHTRMCSTVYASQSSDGNGQSEVDEGVHDSRLYVHHRAHMEWDSASQSLLFMDSEPADER